MIFSNNYNKLLSFAVNLTKDKELAEDILHDVYIKLHEKEDINITYIYNTIKNNFLDRKKKKKVNFIEITDKIEIEVEQYKEDNFSLKEKAYNICFDELKYYEKIIIEHSYKKGLKRFSIESEISKQTILKVRDKFKKKTWEKLKELEEQETLLQKLQKQ